MREVGVNGEMRGRRSVWNVNTQNSLGEHFAVFPPALIEPCILASSRQGDLILDPFFGSGTVGLVCQKGQRRFVGIELNPEYVELAAQRLGFFDSRIVKLQAA